MNSVAKLVGRAVIFEAMVKKSYFAKLALLFIAILPVVGCDQMQHEKCADRLSAHFSMLQSINNEIDSPQAARRVFKQIASVAGTANLDGCNSQTQYAVREIYIASNEIVNSLSDEGILSTYILGWFGAQEHSPLMLQYKQSVKRVEQAVGILRKNGIGNI